MRPTTTITTCLLAFCAVSDAFPHMAAKMAEELSKRQLLPSIPSAQGDFTGAPTTVFSASEQYVSNKGAHAYVAPNFAAGDTRGPCPGLNALANHNYINHNGVTTLTQAIQATTAGFGMGADLAGFLSTISVLFDGAILTQQWSIGSGGGTGVASLGGLLNAGDGLTGSHNKYETDSSPMRGDLYEYCGDNYEVQLSQYQVLYDYYKGVPDNQVSFSFSDLAKFRSFRFNQSVAENPHFFYGPFSGLIVSQAAFTFIPAFMSNHSAAYPNGVLSRQTLNSFFGVTENNSDGKGGGKLTYAPGTEKFPDNWYRRPTANAYSIPEFAADVLRMAGQYPQITSVGGNTNGVNTFTGVSLGDTFGSAFNAQNLLKGNNLQCFIYGITTQITLDATKGLTSTLTSAVTSLLNQYAKAPVSFGCPQFTTPIKLDGYPGVENGTQTKCS